MSLPPLVVYLFPFLGGLLYVLDGVTLFSLLGLVTPTILAYLTNRPIKTIPYTMLLCISFFLIGVTHMRWQEHIVEVQNAYLSRQADSGEKTILEGVIQGLPVPTRNGIRTIVALSSGAHIVLYVRRALINDLSPGDLIRFNCKLSRIRNYRTPGTFNRVTWWRERGIIVQGFTSYPFRCVVLKHSIFPNIGRLRQAIANLVTSNLPQDTSPVALAILVGEKAWMPWKLKEAYYKTGTGHVLAVSGVHMATVFLLFSLIVRAILSINKSVMLRVPVIQISLVVGTVASLGYLGLSGFAPSATRAFIMVMAFSSCFLLRREMQAMDALFLAAWLIILINPYSVKSPSFLLSFVAVFFILWFDTWIRKGGYLANLVKLSIVAWFATLPISSTYFHRIGMASVPTNLVIVPIVGLVLIPLLIGTLVLTLSIHSNPVTVILWWCADKVIHGLNSMVTFISTLVPSSMITHHFSPVESLGFYAALLALGHYYRHPKHIDTAMGGLLKRKPVVILATALLGWTIFLFHTFKGQGVQLYVLDVGQGLSQVILSQDKTAIIDAGGGTYPYDMGRLVVVPFLEVKNRNRVDYLILSHLDRDHAGGAEGILAEFKVKTLILPGYWRNTPLYKRLISLAEKRHVEHIVCMGKKTLYIAKETRLELYPYEGNKTAKKPSNNLGIVAYLKCGRHNILMPGDIERPREARLLDALPNTPLDVMVAPHHGSNTSSSPAFVRYFRPRIVIFSYGYKNSLGFPSPNVVKRYEDIGAKIMDTAHQGTIAISITQDAYNRDYVLKATSMTN